MSDLRDDVLAALTTEWQTTAEVARQVPWDDLTPPRYVRPGEADWRNHLRRVRKALWALVGEQAEHHIAPGTWHTAEWRLRP